MDSTNKIIKVSRSYKSNQNQLLFSPLCDGGDQKPGETFSKQFHSPFTVVVADVLGVFICHSIIVKSSEGVDIP